MQTSDHNCPTYARGWLFRGGGARGSVRRTDDRVTLEVHQIRPRGHPRVEQRTIVALHDLIAAREIVGHPARDVRQAVGRETSLHSKTLVDGSSACSEVL